MRCQEKACHWPFTRGWHVGNQRLGAKQSQTLFSFKKVVQLLRLLLAVPQNSVLLSVTLRASCTMDGFGREGWPHYGFIYLFLLEYSLHEKL